MYYQIWNTSSLLHFEINLIIISAWFYYINHFVLVNNIFRLFCCATCSNNHFFTRVTKMLSYCCLYLWKDDERRIEKWIKDERNPFLKLFENVGRGYAQEIFCFAIANNQNFILHKESLRWMPFSISVVSVVFSAISITMEFKYNKSGPEVVNIWDMRLNGGNKSEFPCFTFWYQKTSQ